MLCDLDPPFAVPPLLDDRQTCHDLYVTPVDQSDGELLSSLHGALVEYQLDRRLTLRRVQAGHIAADDVARNVRGGACVAPQWRLIGRTVIGAGSDNDYCEGDRHRHTETTRHRLPLPQQPLAQKTRAMFDALHCPGVAPDSDRIRAQSDSAPYSNASDSSNGAWRISSTCTTRSSSTPEWNCSSTFDIIESVFECLCDRVAEGREKRCPLHPLLSVTEGPVWVQLDHLFPNVPLERRKPSTGTLNVQGDVPGELRKWERATDGRWLGVVDYAISYTDERSDHYELPGQLVPAWAIRPRNDSTA